MESTTSTGNRPSDQRHDPLEHYTTIGEKAESNISYRVILDHDGQPRVLGLWGRFVRFLKDFWNATEAQTQNQTVREHFKLAIKEKYGTEFETFVENKIKEYQHRSLRAKDVHQVLTDVEEEVQDKRIEDQYAKLNSLLERRK